MYKIEEKIANLTRTWRAIKLLQVANAEVDLNLKFPGQNNKQGIGSGNFNPNPKAQERRKLLTAKAFSFAEKKESTSLCFCEASRDLAEMVRKYDPI